MTKDFRNVGRVSAPVVHDSPSPMSRQDTSPQPIVLGALYLAAVGFFLAGLWLATGGASPFPQEVSRILGFAFMIAAISDVVAARIIKRAWEKRTART